jgi:flagellar biosynthesis protein FlhG
MIDADSIHSAREAATAQAGRAPGWRRRVDGAQGLSPAPVFAFTSGKGGVGKTNMVANLATALAGMNKRVMAIDADLGLANLDLFLGVHPTFTLADFFTGDVPLDQVVVTNGDGILLLPGASGVQSITALNPGQKAALVTELDAMTQGLDLVLVDTGSGISDAVTYFTTAAQEIVIVVAPEPASITDAYALVKVLASSHGQKRFLILVNSAAHADEAQRLFATLSAAALRFLNVSLDYLGWIPRDPQLLRAVVRAQTVVKAAPQAPSAQALTAMAEQFVGMAQSIKAKGNVQFFLRRMIEGGKAKA